MPISKEQLDELNQLGRKASEWFSIAEIAKRDPHLLARHFIRRSTREEIAIPHESHEIYRKLDMWAAHLLEHEVRSYEMRISEKYIEDSLTPTKDDDVSVLKAMTSYIKTTESELRVKLHRLVNTKRKNRKSPGRS